MTTNSYVLFRQPSSAEAFRIVSNADVVTDIADVACDQGFLFAPFTASAEVPALFFRGEPKRFDVDAVKCAQHCVSECDERADRTAYSLAFERMHDAVRSGKLSKVVLGRRAEVDIDHVDADALFAEACRRNADMFVALVVTPRNGTWLMATPELLAQSERGCVKVMALAGTMSNVVSPTCEWSQKNRDEHQVVVDYIAGKLQPLADGALDVCPTLTVPAGAVLHLRTLFNLRLKAGVSFADVAKALHPTSAVCGMPKEEALSIIQAVEPTPREYYSGFAGPIMADSQALYVSLRCMKLQDGKAYLYAGGGIMPDSVEEEEWQETQAKMRTMRALLK